MVYNLSLTLEFPFQSLKLFGHKKLHNFIESGLVLLIFCLRDHFFFFFYNIPTILDSFEWVLLLLEFVFH